jgi:hypothetical protein
LFLVADLRSKKSFDRDGLFMGEGDSKALSLGMIIAITLATAVALGLVFGLIGGMLGLPSGITGGVVGALAGGIAAFLMSRRRAALDQQHKN